jgi:hypothetical protein
MKMSGQLRAPTALPPVKQPLVPIVKEPAWAPESVSTLWRGKNLLPLSGIEPRFLSRRSRSLVAAPTELITL